MSEPITLSSTTRTLTKVNTNPFVTYSGSNTIGGDTGAKKFFKGLETTPGLNNALYYYSTTYSSAFSGGTDYLYIIYYSS
jgi:hypothetical protein